MNSNSKLSGRVQHVRFNEMALIRERNKHSLHNKLCFKTIRVELIMSDI